MNTVHTDIAIIGAGTAGLAAYRAARAAGQRALLIEGGAYGTTCARVGCMPSKLLIAAAEAAHTLAHSADFGIRLPGPVAIDGRAVMARVKRERDRFVGFVINGVEALPATDCLQGHARFIDNSVLQVGDHTQVHASRIVIATGSSPAIPASFHALGDRLVVNDDIFSWDDLPQRVAVFGPGIIGLELGQALARLGVTVRLFGARGGVGPLTDPAIRAYAKQTFQREFYLDPDAHIIDMTREDDSVRIRYTSLTGKEVSESFDYVLAATGRRPNVDNLGLEHTGLALDANGVPLFDPLTLQCGTTPIFIAGDANNVLPLLHEAVDDGVIAGNNAAHYPTVTAGTRRAPLAVVFSDPQIAMVGSRFSALTPGSFITGTVSFEDQGRSRILLQNQGLMHLYIARDTGRLLGAEWIGPRAEHLAHLLAWSIQQALTVHDMLAMPFYHPVIEEGLRTALRDAAAQLTHAD